MLQENQEAAEPPRQSASFKVLQEILETGTERLMFVGGLDALETSLSRLSASPR